MEHEITVLHAEQIAAPAPQPRHSTKRASSANLTTPRMAEDFREHLRRNLGRYCVCEFFPGDGQCRVQEGILREIGQSYFLLYREDTDTTIACDFSSLRFVTCHGQNRRPSR